MEIDLSHKKALITGATGELGRVMVRTLARCGASVAIHYLKNKAKAHQLQQELFALERQSILVQADVTDFNSVNRMSEIVQNDFGDIDILVINAVIQYEWKTILEQSPEDYLSQFNSCVMQSVYLTKAFVPGMVRKRYGRVIGINTECAMQNSTHQSAYTAGKRGMDGVLRVLAKEVGEHQITVNQVAPGWTISDRVRAQHAERQESYEKDIPLKRRGTDSEVANVVAFLASDLAGFITGAYIPVCGGNVMPAI
jgi:3-oxoacyl-[acyl-carrier protein] reductase